MSNDTFFEELCYAPDREIEVYLDALDTIYNEEVKMIDLGVDSEVRMYLEEEDALADKIEAKAKKFIETIKKAIEMIAKKINEFWVYLKHKVQQFIRGALFKKAQIQGIISNEKTYDVTNLPALEKAVTKFEKDMIGELKGVIDDIKSGHLPTGRLSSIAKKIEDGNARLEKLGNDNKVKIKGSALISLKKKYADWLERDEYISSIHKAFTGMVASLDTMKARRDELIEAGTREVTSLFSKVTAVVKKHRAKIVAVAVGILGIGVGAVAYDKSHPKVEIYDAKGKRVGTTRYKMTK